MTLPDSASAPQGASRAAPPSRRARILIVDDVRQNVTLLSDPLTHAGHECIAASSGTQALELAAAMQPDLILLDVLMPDLDGFEVCRRLRADAAFEATPIVMVTSLDAKEERIRGLDAGADDFLSKPIVRAELQARVKSLLRVKTLYDEVNRQKQELARWSATLERRVDEKVREVAQLSRLTRFFSPALAKRLLADGGIDPLQSHRRDVTVLFADLRGFTAFAESADAQAVMEVLREFHAAMGALIHRHEGTLERFTGDGMMVFFNDPDPLPDHALRALALAFDMRAEAARLQQAWQARGVSLGFGIGIALGMATLGAIGFESRVDYAAIGSVTNLAARLCSEAQSGEILVSDAVWQATSAHASADAVLLLSLKGFAQPVRAHAMAGLRPGTATTGPATPSAT